MNDKIIDFIRKKLEKERIENHSRFEKAWQDFHLITALIYKIT